MVNATPLSVRSTEVCDDEVDSQQSTLDQFKFSRTRSMRGPKGLRISKVYPQGRDSDTMATLTLSSEDEGTQFQSNQFIQHR